MDDIERLKNRVDLHFPPRSFRRVKYIYRDKPRRFFDEAELHGGIMKMYIKDNSGDPRSPINGRINGLFFACNEHMYGFPPMVSYFGNTRIKVPVEFFLSAASKRRYNCQRAKLYFADFHCMSKTIHWVTLVLTFESSPADVFCRGRLPELDLHNNTFLRLNYDGTVERREGSHLEVEVFFTEDIDMNYWKENGAVVESVSPAGKGSSTPGGKPKRSYCSICNI